MSAGPRCGERPVPVDVAVPVERSGEVVAREVLDEGGQPVFPQPRGGGLGSRQGRQQARLPGDHRVRLRHFPGKPVQEPAERVFDVGGELLLRDAGLLEVQLVVVRPEHPAGGFERRPGRAAGVRHAEPRHAAHQVGPEQRGVPGDRGSPVVTDHQRVRRAELRDEPDDVSDEVEQVVVLGRRGFVRPLGETVQQDHERPFPGFGEREVQALDPDGAVVDFRHGAGKPHRPGTGKGRQVLLPPLRKSACQLAIAVISSPLLVSPDSSQKNAPPSPWLRA